MPYHDSIKKRRNRRGHWLFRILGFLFLIVIAVLGWSYGPELYYRLSGDTLFRVSQQNEKLAQNLLKQVPPAKRTSVVAIVKQIEENRKILNILYKASPADERVHFQLGLLDFLEMLSYMPLHTRNLIQLCGRAYLPVIENQEGLPPKKTILPLALSSARWMRKSLAIKTDSGVRDSTMLVISLSDLIFNGRMDPQLQNNLDQIQFQNLPPYMSGVYDWLTLAVFTLKGKLQAQGLVLDQINTQESDKSTETQTSPTTHGVYHLQLDPVQMALLKSYGNFHAANYLNSLILARRIKSNTSYLLEYRVEAARLIAEIFIIQRGKGSGAFFMKAAWDLSENKDDFVKTRLDQLLE